VHLLSVVERKRLTLQQHEGELELDVCDFMKVGGLFELLKGVAEELVYVALLAPQLLQLDGKCVEHGELDHLRLAVNEDSHYPDKLAEQLQADHRVQEVFILLQNEEYLPQGGVLVVIKGEDMEAELDLREFEMVDLEEAVEEPNDRVRVKMLRLLGEPLSPKRQTVAVDARVQCGLEEVVLLSLRLRVESLKLHDHQFSQRCLFFGEDLGQVKVVDHLSRVVLQSHEDLLLQLWAKQSELLVLDELERQVKANGELQLELGDELLSFLEDEVQRREAALLLR